MSRKETVVKNLAVVAITQLVSWGLAFVVTFYLPNYLGALHLGYFDQAGAAASLLAVFVPLGTSTLLAREVAAAPERVGEFLATTLLIRCAFGVLSILLALVVVPLLHKPPVVGQLTFLILGTLLVSVLGEAFSAALRGLDRMARGSLNAFAEKIVYTVFVLFCVFTKMPLVVIGFASLLSILVSITMNLVSFRTLLPTLRIPPVETIRFFILGSLPFFVNILFLTIYTTTDTLVMGQLANSTASGWYSVAFRVLGLLVFAPVALCAVIMPTLIHLHAQDEARFVQTLRRVLGYILFLAAPLALPTIFASDRLLFELMPFSREKYAPSAAVMSVFGINLIFLFLTQVAGTVINNVLRRERQMVIVFFIAMILTVGGCLIAVPFTHKVYGNGAIGGAIVDTTVEAFIVVSMFLILPRHYFNRDSLRQFILSLIAAVPLTLLIVFAPPGALWVWGAALLGGVIYLGLCLLLRVVDRQDIDFVRQTLLRRNA